MQNDEMKYENMFVNANGTNNGYLDAQLEVTENNGQPYIPQQPIQQNYVNQGVYPQMYNNGQMYGNGQMYSPAQNPANYMQGGVRCPYCGGTNLQAISDTHGKGASFWKLCLCGFLGLCGAGKTKTEHYWVCTNCGNRFKM